MNPAVTWGTAGTVIGLAVGYAIGRTALEGKLRAEYRASSEAMRNAFELARKVEPEAPAQDEHQLDIFEELAQDLEPVQEIGEGVQIVTTINEPAQNDYHRAIAAVETPVEVFVEGGVNDYGMSYIEEEDYLDEDGRFKGKIDILMDEHNPTFLMDGQVIDDWDKRIGDSILVDFYKLVPPGVDPVLYVRNHRTDEDYEVVRVMP